MHAPDRVIAADGRQPDGIMITRSRDARLSSVICGGSCPVTPPTVEYDATDGPRGAIRKRHCCARDTGSPLRGRPTGVVRRGPNGGHPKNIIRPNREQRKISTFIYGTRSRPRPSPVLLHRRHSDKFCKKKKNQNITFFIRFFIASTEKALILQKSCACAHEHSAFTKPTLLKST